MWTTSKLLGVALLTGLAGLSLTGGEARAQNFSPGWTYRFYYNPQFANARQAARYSNLNPRYTAYIANYQANLAAANPFYQQWAYQQYVNNQLRLAAAATAYNNSDAAAYYNSALANTPVYVPPVVPPVYGPTVVPGYPYR
jgi:hypothetical protein